MSEETWKVKELGKGELLFDDCIRAVRSWKVVHTDEGGYVESDIHFHVMKDGGLWIRDVDRDSVSLSKEEVDVLRKILEEMQS